MLITTDNIKYNLGEHNRLDQGAEAVVYKIQNDTLVKIINEDFKSENKINKILALCDKSDYLSEIQGFENISIPIFPTYNSEGICGYTMDFYKDCKTISELNYSILESKYSFNNINDEIIFKIIEKLFFILQVLHQQKIILGDVSSNNILWHPVTNQVYIIDLDSAKVGDFYAKMSTPDYLCPVVKNIGEDNHGGLSFSTSSDIYSLTIICFEILMGIHPCDVGTQPVLNKSEKMEKGVTYLGYHYTKNKIINNCELFENRDSYQLISNRLDYIKKNSPKIYNHFITVFHLGKRQYLNRKNIIKGKGKKRVRKIKAIRTPSRNKKQYDPIELYTFLETYHLKTPNYVK